MGEHSPWPKEDIGALAYLVRQGLSATQISQKFDGRYSRDAIIGRCNRTGLKLQGGVSHESLANISLGGDV